MTSRALGLPLARARDAGHDSQHRDDPKEVEAAIRDGPGLCRLRRDHGSGRIAALLNESCTHRRLHLPLQRSTTDWILGGPASRGRQMRLCSQDTATGEVPDRRLIPMARIAFCGALRAARYGSVPLALA